MRRKSFPKRKPKEKVERTTPFNIPDDKELAKVKNDLVKFKKQLKPDGSPLKPLTKSQIMSLCRGAIRQKWMFASNKLAYMNMGVVPDYDTNTRRRFKVQCEYCLEWFKRDEVVCDHENGEHSLKDGTDIETFADSILNVNFAGLKRTCQPCHDRKTAMERWGYTEEEARIFKMYTAWVGANKIPKQKEWLQSKGVSLEDCSNEPKRRKSYFEIKNAEKVVES